MARYLITGGAGFIGSHLAEHLVKDGQDVVVLDNFYSGKRENLLPAQAGPGSFTLVEGDIVDPEACRRAAGGADYVLHQAARPSVQRSVDDPLGTHAVNTTGTLNVLGAAREAGVKRVVLAASSSAYGDVEPLEAPKVETMRPRPMSPYSASKVAMEHYAQAYHKVYGLETVCLRYFNVFGARQDPNSAYAAVIPKFLFALMAGERPTVFGDGRQSRDFTYIDNVVQANLKACVAPLAPGRVMNVASGKSYDLLVLLEILGELLGVRPNPRFLEPRVGDVRYSLADLGLARELLGYEVKVDFRDGLARVVELARRGRYL